MQSMPESRHQTFEEIYGPPENFLEIEVRPPVPLLPLLSAPLLSSPQRQLTSALVTTGQEPTNPRL